MSIICQATFRDESPSLSDNIVFQLFQNCCQNFKLFSINPIKSLNIYIDSKATNFMKSALIFA